MSKIVWDQTGERFYETGVKMGVLYVKEGNTYGKGVAWNGLTAVTESPSGAEATALYADDIKYLNLVSAEEFAAEVISPVKAIFLLTLRLESAQIKAVCLFIPFENVLILRFGSREKV